MRSSVVPGKCSPSLQVAAAALLLTSLAVSAADVRRQLTCPPSVVADVPVTCYDSGSVLAGVNLTYSFAIEEGGEPFDLVLTLHTQSGDADLLLRTPSGQALASRHGSGEDVVFLPRAQVAAGQYVATVQGASDESSYKLLVEKNRRRRRLAGGDAAALREILDGPCCARPGSCGTLRTALGGGGTADGTADGGAAADLCNTGRNLCDPEGHLLHLALVQERLSCPFPGRQLAALRHLLLLDLTMNELTGALQGEVAPVLQQLPTLQNLLLSHNQLHGRLTCELATPSLAELGLAANQLTGTVPPCLLASPPLQELYLGSNGLEGQLPAPPPDSRLLIISAFANRLSGSLPDLSALPQLQALQLQGNRFTGPLPRLPPAMRHVDVEGNHLSGTIPGQWAELMGLRALRLRRNALSGSLPPGLAALPALEQLLAAHNRLGGALPAEWRAPVLARVDLQHNSFAGTLPAGLGGLHALEVLQLGGNALEGSLDAFAQAAARVEGGSRLQLLDLAGNRLSGTIPGELQRLGLFAGGGGFTLVSGLAVPDSLDLSGNQLSGPFPGWVIEALVGGKVVVSLAGNRLACPEGPIPVSAELKRSRMLGLECVAADGTVRLVADLVRVASQLHSEPAAGTGSDGNGSSDSGSPGQAGAGQEGGATSSGGKSGGGKSGFAGLLMICGLVLGASAVAAAAGPPLLRRLWPPASLRCQQHSHQYSAVPPCADAAATAALAAKQRAVALSELRGGGGEGPAGSKPAGLAGACEAGEGAAAASCGSSTGGLEAGHAFQIGTRVHPAGLDAV